MSRRLLGTLVFRIGRQLCTFILFQEFFQPLSPIWDYCSVLKFPCTLIYFVLSHIRDSRLFGTLEYVQVACNICFLCAKAKRSYIT